MASSPQGRLRRGEEVPVFQMIDEEKVPENRGELLMKIGMFIAAVAVLGGVIYFFGFH